MDVPHMHGVALILSRTTQKTLIRWEAQIITACFYTKTRRLNMDIIHCYTPRIDSKVNERGILQQIADHYPEPPRS